MKSDERISERGDILSDRLITVLVFWFPIAALIVSGALRISNEWRAAVWGIALTTIGIGCLVNAVRCGRVHCYFTGPFFLAMAILTLLYGFHIARIGAYGWNLISLTVLVGGLLLCYVPEVLIGRYWQRLR